MAKMVAANTGQIIGNIAAAVDGRDPEGVHQLRTGFRRLNTSFALFNDRLTPGTESVAAAARRAFRATGDARASRCLFCWRPCRRPWPAIPTRPHYCGWLTPREVAAGLRTGRSAGWSENGGSTVCCSISCWPSRGEA
ncbi:MAG: CHAD domain-containing protein [bacterium]|nr:CHAD domain-containing protein [bacterium]